MFSHKVDANLNFKSETHIFVVLLLALFPTAAKQFDYFKSVRKFTVRNKTTKSVRSQICPIPDREHLYHNV